MYIVELGQTEDYNYYSFHFDNYDEAIKFMKVLILNGYVASISIEDKE